MIDLHYWPTPNGKKVTILLEELGMPYKVIPCNIGKGDQFTDDFLKIGPNNRMPAIVDHAPKGGGEPISIFESGAIMMYLAEKAGRFYPQDVRGRTEVNQWVIWQMANQGPKTGECRTLLAGSATPRATRPTPRRRFSDEVNRLYGVMNNRLYDRRYLAGDEYTIADMISLSLDGELEGAGPEHRRLQIFQALVRGAQRAPGGAARPRRDRGRAGGRSEHALGRGEGAPREAAL